MPLTNPGTAFDEDGWADAIGDIRKLFQMIEGGGNDLNNQTKEVTQVSDQFKEITVEVCIDDVRKHMKVYGTDPE